MRSLWNSYGAAVLVLGVVPALASAQNKPTPERLLELQPSLKGVEFDTPSDPAAIAACKVDLVAHDRQSGYALRDGQGKLLRRFLDTNGDNALDQWSYYQDGFEVYRESDLNGDKIPDECRWLNTAGTRVAEVKSVQAAPKKWVLKVVRWKRISAEEASKVLVQALVMADLDLLETLLARPEELKGLGVPQGQIDQVAAAAEKRREQVTELIKVLAGKGWNSQTAWQRLDGIASPLPHLIPADPGTGLTQDLSLYENAVIFAGPPNGQANPGKVAFLQAPEIVRIGETWKFLELPRAVDPEKPVVTAEGGLRAWLFRGANGSGALAQNPEMEAALRKLADYDTANAQAQAGASKKDVARYHVERIPLLRAVVKAAKSPEDQLVYNKQVVESLVAAVQTGAYPQGVGVLEGLVGEGGKLGSYAAFRKLNADFNARNEEPGANTLANQKKWMADLKDFLDKFAKSDEAPDALLQLASIHEFNAEEDEARAYYGRLAREFPSTETGKKGAGALQRLDLVGKSLALKGAGLKGEPIDTTASAYRGKTLLVTFWASWAEPFQRELPELLKLSQKHKPDGFEVVGVNLDNDRADAERFIAAHHVPWPEIHEPGGIEGRLATEYGIIVLPTMILVDNQGKVISRNIRSAAELERELSKVLTGKTPGVALDEK